MAPREAVGAAAVERRHEHFLPWMGYELIGMWYNGDLPIYNGDLPIYNGDFLFIMVIYLFIMVIYLFIMVIYLFIMVIYLFIMVIYIDLPINNGDLYGWYGLHMI